MGQTEMPTYIVHMDGIAEFYCNDILSYIFSTQI